MGCKQPNFQRKTPSSIINKPFVDEKIPLRLDEKYIFQSYLSDKKEKSQDRSFIKLLEFEKEELKKLFKSLAKNYENIVLQVNYFKLNNIEEKLISDIVENEQSSLVYKKKIVDAISDITKKKEEYKIKQLTILVIGKKLVGKSTLIKYILKLDENENEINNNIENIESGNIREENFISYKSKKVPYLKLIEFKGIGHDSNISPENIQNEALQCIKNKISATKIENEYNEYINCIWYCITGARLENAEMKLLMELSKAYTDKEIPIILVYTRSIDEDDANELKLYTKTKIEKASFVDVLAKSTKIINTDKILMPKGDEQLLSETLLRCTEALQGKMIEFMTDNISNDIKNKIKDEIKNIYTDITKNFEEKFNAEFNEVKYDNEFLDYVVKIFGDNIIKFYKHYSENISIKSLNVIKKSSIIKNINSYISIYKQKVKEIIESNIKKKAELFIDKQASVEIEENSNLRIENKRSLNRFISTNIAFLKRNFYFMSQKYIFHSIFKRIWGNFFKLYKNKLNEIIDKLIGKETDFDIIENLHYCFLMKLDDFSKDKNIPVNIRFPQLQAFYQKSKKIMDEKYEYDEKRNNSIDSIDNFNLDLINIEQKNTPYQYEILQKFDENKFTTLSDDIKNSLSNFLQKEIVYQEDSFKKKDNTDKIFNELKDYIEIDLINFFESQKNDFILNKINLPYSLKFLIANYDSIDQLIKGEEFEKIYKVKINNKIDLINKNINFCKIDYLTIIVLGKSGVGKSTLVNSMLLLDGNEKAKTGKGGIQTKKNCLYKSKKIPFLKIYDTRGMELEHEYDSNSIYNNAMSVIQESMKGENFNDCVQCIWYCFYYDHIDKVEIELIKKLKENNPSIQIVLIYTRALSEDSYNSIKSKIEQNFPNYPFINLLAEAQKEYPSYGLNRLLEITLENCKNEFGNRIYKDIRKKSYSEIEKNLADDHKLINQEILNEVTKSFIDNYKKVLNDDELLKYTYDLLKNILGAYMKVNNKEVKVNFEKNTLRKIVDIETFIKNFIGHYTITTNETIKPFLEKYAIQFLDMQLSFEKKYNRCINHKIKKNKNGFKEMIETFLNDNFYYISQKYIIYRILYYYEKISLKIKESANNLVQKLLDQKEPEDLLKKVHKHKFKDLVNRIDKLKKEDNKIYEEKIFVDNSRSNAYGAAPAPKSK